MGPSVLAYALHHNGSDRSRRRRRLRDFFRRRGAASCYRRPRRSRRRRHDERRPGDRRGADRLLGHPPPPGLVQPLLLLLPVGAEHGRAVLLVPAERPVERGDRLRVVDPLQLGVVHRVEEELVLPALLADADALAGDGDGAGRGRVVDGQAEAVGGVRVRAADHRVRRSERLVAGEGGVEVAVLVVRGVALKIAEGNSRYLLSLIGLTFYAAAKKGEFSNCFLFGHFRGSSRVHRARQV